MDWHVKINNALDYIENNLTHDIDYQEVATWAVFEVKGAFPEALQDIWGRIYSEWFSSVSYEITEGPEILRMIDNDTSLPEVKSEIWIPVKKK